MLDYTEYEPCVQPYRKNIHGLQNNIFTLLTTSALPAVDHEQPHALAAVLSGVGVSKRRLCGGSCAGVRVLCDVFGPTFSIKVGHMLHCCLSVCLSSGTGELRLNGAR